MDVSQYNIGWAYANTGTLAICVILTLLSAFITVVFSMFFGATLAFHARPTLRYWAVLVFLFVPFAVGSSVWAYSISRLASWSGMQVNLVTSDTWDRASLLLILCVGRALPLGTFFCATALHRYTSEIRPYLQTHHISLPFYLLCALNRMPKSIVMLLGLFGGSLMATEASLPTFLYRANPGTQPETVNIMLARLFREMYANYGPECLSQVASLGLFVSFVLFVGAILGSLAGRCTLNLARALFHRCYLFTGIGAVVFSVILHVGVACCFAPGILGLIGLFVPLRMMDISFNKFLDQVFNYRDINVLGMLVGGGIILICVAVAIRLRYGQKDLLAWVESKPLFACILMLPAFIPVLSVVAVLGKISEGQMTSFSGYLSMIISHFGLHYSIFQFICISLIATIPERHVSWQRAMRIRYFFSLMTDGFKRHSSILIGLLGMCTVQVITDGTVSRWFSHLVKAPEEALYAAIFGRLSNANEAVIITWSVGLVAIAICSILAAAYVRELANRQRYD